MKQTPNKNSPLIKILIIIPISFLLIYHTTKLYNIHFGNDIVTSEVFLKSFTNGFPMATFLIVQSVFRAIIITSLVLILLKKNIGILLMWLGIGSLILSQFYIASESTNEIIQAAHSGLKPLKGLILPIVVTYLNKKTNRTN